MSRRRVSRNRRSTSTLWGNPSQNTSQLRARTPPKLARTRRKERCTRDNAETIEKVVQADAFFGESAFIPRQVRGEHKPSSASFADDRPFRLRFDVRFASRVYEEYALKRLLFYSEQRKTGSTHREVRADVSTSRESPVVDRRTAREIRGKRRFGLLERWI